MKVWQITAAALLASVALSAPAQTKTMSEQAAEDWDEIKDVAGKVADKTVETGKVVGTKAAEVGRVVGAKAAEVGQVARDKAVALTDDARATMAEDERLRQEAEKKDPARKKAAQRFFY